MKTDGRDEHLGSILRDAMVDVDLGWPDPTIVMRRGVRRRTGSAIASIAVAGAFVAAIGVAATRFGQDAPPPPIRDPQPSVSSDVPDGWTAAVVGPGRFATEVTYPKRWALEPIESLSFDSPTQPVFRLATSNEAVHGVACGSLEVLPGAPTIMIGRDPLGPFEALLSVQAYTGAGWAEPARVPRFAPRPARLDWPDAQSGRIYNCVRPAETFTFFVRDGGRWIFHVTMGSSVMDSGVADDLLTVLNTVVLPPDPTSPIRFLPSDGWASDATNAVNEVSAWTSSAVMTAGEATFPDPADLSQEEILVTAFQVGDEPPPPDNPNFSPAGLPLDLPEEIETSWEGYTEGRSRSTLWVAVNGRALQIHVYYGTTDPSEELLSEAGAALERLIVDPVPAPAALPPPVRDDFRSQFVSDERGYRFWPRSGHAERGVVYRFEVPHCGLDWLVDFDGSFWEGRAIVDGTNWVPAEDIPDGDTGTIELTGANWARYEASDGTWTLLSRVEGSIVRQLCD
jgi:hypothetical protein